MKATTHVSKAYLLVFTIITMLLSMANAGTYPKAPGTPKASAPATRPTTRPEVTPKNENVAFIPKELDVAVTTTDTLQIAKKPSERETSIEEFHLADSKRVFEVSCIQCHTTSLVERHPPRTQKQAEELVNRMVDNGLDLSDADLRKIVFYLKTTYAK